MSKSNELPRLSIGHLLLLTFCVALALAAYTPILHNLIKSPPEMFREDKTVLLTFRVLEVLAIGIKGFAIVVLLRQLVQNKSFEFAPGHWYFLTSGTANIAILCYQLLTFAFDLSFSLVSLIDGVIYLLAAILGIKGTMASKEMRWRIALSLLAAYSLTFVFIHAIFLFSGMEILLSYWAIYSLDIISLALKTAFCIAALTALAIDRLLVARYDWLHYWSLVPLLISAADAARNIVQISIGLAL